MTNKPRRDEAAIAQQWADAPTLHEYLKDCAAQLRAAKRSAVGTRDSGSKIHPLEGAVLSLQEFNATQAALKEAARKVNDDLVANRIACIGRTQDTVSLERISASFWIGAQIHWDKDLAVRRAAKIVDLRVVTEPKSAPIEIESSPKPGRPSKKEVIRKAIEEHAKSDPGLMRPKLERFKAYRSYISCHGYNPHQESGFSDKTIEKYETEFRRKSN